MTEKSHGAATMPRNTKGDTMGDEYLPALETVMVGIDELVPYANNAKLHPPEQIEHIAASIRRFGFCDPVGAWHNADGGLEIVTSHGAVMAAKQLGMAQVPCTFLDHLTDEERRAYCHVHNATQIETGFDADTLMADMSALDMDWDEFGFADYVQEFDQPETVEVDVPESAPARTQAGDVFRLGGHMLLCGDATDRKGIESLISRGGGCLIS